MEGDNQSNLKRDIGLYNPVSYIPLSLLFTYLFS